MNSIQFRYFASPHQFSSYVGEAQICDLCKEIRPGYKGSFYGPEDIEFVCEMCLAEGRLAAHDLSTNEGNIEELQLQLQQLRPDLSLEQIDGIAQQRTEELEQRTPVLLTWQDWFWPVHCGDYCQFIKEAGKPDLIALARDGDGKSFFHDHLADLAFTDVDAVWNSIRLDSPTTYTEAYTVGVYLFQCLECNQYIIVWDCD